MRGIHLKEIDADRRELPEYREGSFHIPVSEADPFLECELWYPDSIPDLARQLRLQLEKTLELLNEVLAQGAADPTEEAP